MDAEEPSTSSAGSHIQLREAYLDDIAAYIAESDSEIADDSDGVDECDDDDDNNDNNVWLKPLESNEGQPSAQNKILDFYREAEEPSSSSSTSTQTKNLDFYREAEEPSSSTSSAETRSRKAYLNDIAAYLADDDEDDDGDIWLSPTVYIKGQPSTQTKSLESYREAKEPSSSSTSTQIKNREMHGHAEEPSSSTSPTESKSLDDIASYIGASDSDDNTVTTAIKVPDDDDDDPWSKPLIFFERDPSPSPSVSSVGDLWDQLDIPRYELEALNEVEDDDPLADPEPGDIPTLEEWNEIVASGRLPDIGRTLCQRFRAMRKMEKMEKRMGKRPVEAPKTNPIERIEELMALPSVETLKISDESKAEVESLQTMAAETRLVNEQREKLTKERLLREEAQRKLKERTAKGPRQPMVAPLSDAWIEKVIGTIDIPEGEVVAKTCQGTPLRPHDFATVVAAKTWLNDEIVNGALAELEKQINLVAGITDYKQQGRKCLVMNSFFWPRVKEAHGKKTQSILRRMGVTPKNFLLMDTVLVPICEDHHWTLLVLQPKQRKMMHLDSFNRRSSHTDYAMAWMSDYLGDLYHTKPWQVMVLKTPQQNNGYDCGVHVITNSVCLALGLDPIASYNVGDLALQRLRIAGMLMNGGFDGDFDLWEQ